MTLSRPQARDGTLVTDVSRGVAGRAGVPDLNDMVVALTSLERRGCNSHVAVSGRLAAPGFPAGHADHRLRITSHMSPGSSTAGRLGG